MVILPSADLNSINMWWPPFVHFSPLQFRVWMVTSTLLLLPTLWGRSTTSEVCGCAEVNRWPSSRLGLLTGTNSIESVSTGRVFSVLYLSLTSYMLLSISPFFLDNALGLRVLSRPSCHFFIIDSWSCTYFMSPSCVVDLSSFCKNSSCSCFLSCWQCWFSLVRCSV